MEKCQRARNLVPEKGFCSDLDSTDVKGTLFLSLLKHTVNRDGVDSPLELHHTIVHIHLAKVSEGRKVTKSVAPEKKVSNLKSCSPIILWPADCMADKETDALGK